MTCRSWRRSRSADRRVGTDRSGAGRSPSSSTTAVGTPRQGGCPSRRGRRTPVVVPAGPGERGERVTDEAAGAIPGDLVRYGWSDRWAALFDEAVEGVGAG